MDKILEVVRSHFANNYTASALKVIITIWAIFVILLAWSTENPWFLAGILAYEILP